MRRREFITILSGAAAMWPLPARAQQSDRVRRIGVLIASTADDPEWQARLAAFQQGLQQLGWSDGRNVHIDTRWASTKPDDIRKQAVELVALTPDVIFAGTGTATVAPLLQATRTLPIVFALVIDPVGAGFIDSLARPGGNATGFTIFEYGPDFVDQYRQAAGYVDRILKGEKPAEMPVQAPTKYEIVINLKTAKTLGLTVAETFLQRADVIIE
jgi:putative ABC transport system substrate-binding protein